MGRMNFLQLWTLGRAAIAAELKSDDLSLEAVAPPPIPLTPLSPTVPKPLTISEIKEMV